MTYNISAYIISLLILSNFYHEFINFLFSSYIDFFCLSCYWGRFECFATKFMAIWYSFDEFVFKKFLQNSKFKQKFVSLNTDIKSKSIPKTIQLLVKPQIKF